MKLTKYSHACLVLEEDGEALVIDPGSFSRDFVVPEHVVAVVITHMHADHCDSAKLQAIVQHNPDAVIYALKEVADTADVTMSAVAPAQQVVAGHFQLEFVGGAHATIHPDMEPIGNIGVMVNHDVLYYPGDSFTPPPRRPTWSAVPVAAPWLKLSEAIEHVRATIPEHAFPTHDVLLSTDGQAVVDRMMSSLTDGYTTYSRLLIGQSIEL